MSENATTWAGKNHVNGDCPSTFPIAGEWRSCNAIVDHDSAWDHGYLGDGIAVYWDDNHPSAVLTGLAKEPTTSQEQIEEIVGESLDRICRCSHRRGDHTVEGRCTVTVLNSSHGQDTICFCQLFRPLNGEPT